MDQSTSLVITSIQDHGNKVLKNYAIACAEKKIRFIVAGDTKSPKDFKLPGCEYLGIPEQEALPFFLAKLLPHKNYAKKNLAYLQAIKTGAKVIIETDDDNIPAQGFWDNRSPDISGDLSKGAGWVNVYSHFSDQFIWPRGFALRRLKEPLLDLQSNPSAYFSPIQQALVDENPDVDAIYRLSLPLPFNFEKRSPVVLGEGSVCPFNSQNTTWFRQAFPLLYIPSYCSFRMCDIWRGFVAQRILWTNDWHLSFHSSTAYQDRNEHDLLKDFEDEISGYLHNESIMDGLSSLNLKKGEAFIYENLRMCYQYLIDKKHIAQKELALLEAWIKDLQEIS